MKSLPFIFILIQGSPLTLIPSGVKVISYSICFFKSLENIMTMKWRNKTDVHMFYLTFVKNN